MIRYSVNTNRIHYCVRSSLILFIFLGFVLSNASGQAYVSLVMEPSAVVNSPLVILQDGTAGTSTVYINNTSAKASVEAPLFDYVDNNDPDVDSNADKGAHSNFTAQLAGPDSIYDTLSEENIEAIEDYADNNTSDEDGSADVGTHSNFENQKARDSTYDTLTEASQANTHSLDATGGYMIVGDGTPDWGSTTGTISFWVKMDTSVQGRFWGQDGNMETRWSGANLVLDWGATNSMISAYSFSADTWCFVAIVWDENNDNLFLYVGDESNTPTLDSNSLSGTWTSTTPIPTENRFMNGGGASEPVDGHGDDLRYWNTARSLAEIQSDYNAELTGSETNLRSYFKLNNNFDDIGPNNDDGTGSGSYSFSTDVSFSGSSDYGLNLEVQWINVIDFLPTEKLCIYTGALSNEDLRVDHWNGTGWENLATDLTPNSCNEYTVSLTSATFTIRFKDGTTTGDTIQDQWQIDASLLRVEGAGIKEDAVDNDASNVDSSADIGNLVNFDNMKAADSVYANLTELAPGGITYISGAEASATSGTSAPVNKPTGTAQNDFMIALLLSTIGSDTDGSTMFSAPSGWTNEHDYIQSAISGQHVYIYWKVAGASEPSSYTWTWTSSCGWVAQITTFRGVDPSSPIHVEGTVNQENTNSPMSPSITTTFDNCMIWLYDMSDGSAVPASGGAPSGTTWIDQTEVATPGNGVGISTAYFVQASAGATGNKDWTLDAIEENSGQQYSLKPLPSNYQVDQEVQWTNVSYSLPNENLSIYCGSMGAEDIKVDVWNGTGWETVFADLSSGWNNVSITNWLTTSNFTVRFKGGNETGDSNQDTWQIDVALIHVWHDGGESYELDLEVQWTSAEYSRAYEVLCIKTGTFSGSENIQVRVWNTTGSTWQWIMNLTANQWNNISITSYLTSSTFTVQFLGGTETSDTAQDSWNIDATLLHVWTGAWLSGWEKRVKITIDSNDVDSALSNFPVLVYLSNSSSGRNNDDVSFVFDEVGSNRKKIAVTKSDGTTQCYVEIEKWDDASEQAWLWVKVPSIINTSDTDLYLYYDNDHADNTDYVDDTNTGNSVNVWDSYFKMVQHMRDNTTSSIVDSTSNDNDGTKKGAGQPAVTTNGKMDGAQNFPSGDVAGGDYINCGNDSSLQITGYLTIGAWVKIAGSDGEYLGIAGKLDDTDMEGYALVRHSDNKFKFWVGDGTMASADSDTSYTDSDWHYVVGVVNNGNNYVYVDGVKQQDEDTTTLIDSGYWAHIGRQYYNYDQRYWEGIIDEVRISNVSRNTAWIRASYESGRDHLIDFASEEGNGKSGGTSEGTYDYVLRVNNTVADAWQIRLNKYADSNISRLQNCTIYFRNSTGGNLSQIVIENGAFVNETGPWYDVGSLETIYIAMTIEATNTVTSYVCAYLEVRTPGTNTYLQYIIEFEIT